MSTLLNNRADAKAETTCCPTCGNPTPVRTAPDRTRCFVVHKMGEGAVAAFGHDAGTVCAGSLMEAGVRS